LYKRSIFLTGKKLLLLQTSFALAALTAERHLQGALLSLAQVVVGQVCKSFDENWVAV
jgi:hypothetical protein